MYLDEIYRKKARYCILFLSTHYATKVWTNHERKSAQARAFSSNQEYILPARFDSTEIPGVLPTVGYVDLTQLTPEAFTEIILKKIRKLPDNRSILDLGKPPEDSVVDPAEKDKDYGTKFVEEELPRIIKRAAKEGTTPAVVFIDIDDLAVINKTYGRDIGNVVIDTVYEIVRRRSFAKAKYKGRCGEDTFYSVLFDADRVHEYCERIRKDVNSYPWRHVTPKLHVSCTIGHAALKPNEDPHELLARAILGMIEGKKRGSNTVQIGHLFSGMGFNRKPAQHVPSLPKTKYEKVEYHSEVPNFSLRAFFS